MEAEILAQLNGINQEFYQNFADSFSLTRARIQPGVRQILQKLPVEGDVLDIGCGNGNLAVAWSQEGFSGSFTGVDFSPGLIADARKNASPQKAEQKIGFHLADLGHDGWISVLPDQTWKTIFCFAMLHHIPAASRRRRLCQQIRSLLLPKTSLWLSVWQPLNSIRLKKRIVGWEVVGLHPAQVEDGDVLMDWRAHQHADENPAYRFVHIFSEKELSGLAKSAGFQVKNSFYSDGKEGNLALYQHWAGDF